MGGEAGRKAAQPQCLGDHRQEADSMIWRTAKLEVFQFEAFSRRTTSNCFCELTMFLLCYLWTTQDTSYFQP